MFNVQCPIFNVQWLARQPHYVLRNPTAPAPPSSPPTPPHSAAAQNTPPTHSLANQSFHSKRPTGNFCSTRFVPARSAPEWSRCGAGQTRQTLVAIRCSDWVSLALKRPRTVARAPAVHHIPAAWGKVPRRSRSCRHWRNIPPNSDHHTSIRQS